MGRPSKPPWKPSWRAWAANSMPTWASSPSTAKATPWPAIAPGTCRTRISAAMRPWSRKCGCERNGAQDSRVHIGRDPRSGPERAAPRTRRPPRLLAIRHRQPGPGRDARANRRARGDGGNGARCPRPPARGLEPEQHLRDLSDMAPPLRSGNDPQHRARVRADGARALAGPGGPEGTPGLDVAAVARGGGQGVLLDQPPGHRNASAPPAGAVMRDPRDLRVVTYNIHKGFSQFN